MIRVYKRNKTTNNNKHHENKLNKTCFSSLAMGREISNVTSDNDYDYDCDTRLELKLRVEQNGMSVEIRAHTHTHARYIKTPIANQQNSQENARATCGLQ